MRLAFFGRFSSDMQREASIEDQRRVVERWAKRCGHTIVAEFADIATSGASLKVLKGLQAAIQAACATTPTFEAIAVDQLSRLSRDIGDTDAIVKKLKFFGIRVIAVQDGIDTSDETTKISVTVKSLVNEMYLDDLRKTTKRGLDGQFLKGFSTGGRTYGFTTEAVFDAAGRIDPHGNPIPVGYKLLIEPQEAALVRDIFRYFAEGMGEKAITKELNRRKAGGRVWRPNTIYLMLRNEKYIGRFVFNKREWRKNPETGRRVPRIRPKDQCEVREAEELRIIDQVTWDLVQRRLETRQHVFSKRRTATVHLLSGLLICDRCGGRLAIIGKDYYGCPNHSEMNTCPNLIRIRREAIERIVLTELATHLPNWIDTLRAGAERQNAQLHPQTADQGRHHLQTLRRKAESIMHAVQSGILTGRALQEALATYQQVWSQLEALEKSDALAAIPEVPPRVAVRYDPAAAQDFVAHLPEGLRANIPFGREFLRDTLVEVRVQDGADRPTICPVCGEPQGNITPQHMQAHGLSMAEAYQQFPGLGFNKEARLQVQPSPDGILRKGKLFGLVVAGAGFEPATFGL